MEEENGTTEQQETEKDEECENQENSESNEEEEEYESDYNSTPENKHRAEEEPLTRGFQNLNRVITRSMSRALMIKEPDSLTQALGHEGGKRAMEDELYMIEKN